MALSWLAQRRLALTDVRIGHLLIVAGPSGSGKSTFLRRLSSGALPADLLAALPSGCSAWPQTSGASLTGSAAAAVGVVGGHHAIPGLVLHYDFMRVFDSLIDDYPQDPSLALVDLAERITAVVIRPSPDRIAAQIMLKRPQERWSRRVGRRLRRALRPLFRTGHRFIYSRAQARDRHVALAAHYRTSGFLDSWYGKWNAFLDHVSRRKQLERITVVPGNSEDDEFTYTFARG